MPQVSPMTWVVLIPYLLLTFLILANLLPAMNSKSYPENGEIKKMPKNIKW